MSSLPRIRRAGPAGRPRDPLGCRSLAREDSDHPVERSLDPTGEGGEDRHRRSRDDGQDDAVLGHGLTLFALAACAESIEPLVQRRHVPAPPFVGRGSVVRSVYLGSRPMTRLRAPLMPPESVEKTPTAPIVITARTTPYSAIV